MDIPEKIAMSGVENVKFYIETKKRIDELNDQYFELRKKLSSLKKSIAEIVGEKDKWVTDSGQINGERPHFNGLKVYELSKMYLEVTFQMTIIENEKTQLYMEIHEKEWLPYWLPEWQHENMQYELDKKSKLR